MNHIGLFSVNLYVWAMRSSTETEGSCASLKAWRLEKSLQSRKRPKEQKSMRNLHDRLDELKETFESGAPPYNVPREAIELMHRATAEIKASALEDIALKVGIRAPGFTLFN